MLISKLKRNQLALSLKRTSSTKAKTSHHVRKTILDSPLDSFLNPSTVQKNCQLKNNSACSDHDPVSTSLVEFQSACKVFSTAQAMDRAIQKVINSSPQPSSSKNPFSYPPIQSTSSSLTGANPLEQTNKTWNQIYVQFLTSSSNPEQFAIRVGDLVNKRLPKRSIDEIFKLHGSLTDLVSVESYNHLIEHSYKTERYHLARSLMTEMKERDIEKNQKTLELIACSYQALNKSKGVQLTINAIKSDGKQLSSQSLTRLFSIRPRRSSKLQHFDSMDDPSNAISNDNSILSNGNLEYQTWMLIEEFLNGHNGNLENLRSDGRALVTIIKRLMETGRWNEARQFADLILKLDLRISALENSPPAINSYWSTSLLEALVFGLYNLKRDTAKSKKKSKAEKLQLSNATNGNFDQGLDENDAKEDTNTRLDCLKDLGINSVFEFVGSFVDQNRSHKIKLNPKILLNCLRIHTSLPPSEIKSLLTKWRHQYGLQPNLLGSRLGIRLLHVISAWFISQIRTVKTHIENFNLSSNSSGDSSDLTNQIHSKINELTQEYSVIDQDFLTCLRGTNISDGQEVKELKMIERMILNGPIDGKFVQTNYRFISFQEVKSIHLSLKKIFKIRSKIQAILKTFLDGKKPDECRKAGVRDELLDQFIDPIEFKSSFYRLINGLKNQIDHHPQELDTKAPSNIHPLTSHSNQISDPSKFLPSLPLSNTVAKNHPIKFHIINNCIVCWSSENLLSSPIYLKSPSTQSS